MLARPARPTRASRDRGVRRCRRCAGSARIARPLPDPAAADRRGLAAPGAGPERRVDLGRDGGAALPARPDAGRGAAARAGRAGCSPTRFVRCAPRIAPGAGGRVRRARPRRAGCSAADARPGELQTVLRGLPHNVTTEMDLALWDLAARLRDDADAVAALHRQPARGARRGAATPAAGARRGTRPRSSPATATAPSPRSTSGMPRWSDDPTPPARRPGQLPAPGRPRTRAPDAVFAAGAARGRRDDRRGSPRRAGGAARPGRRSPPCAGPGDLVGLRELPEVLRSSRCWPPPARELGGGRAPTSPTRGRLEHADDVFFLTSPRPRRGRSTVRDAGPRTARDLRPRAAPPARAAGPALRRHRARGARAGDRRGRRRPHRHPGLGRARSPGRRG